MNTYYHGNPELLGKEKLLRFISVAPKENQLEFARNLVQGNVRVQPRWAPPKTIAEFYSHRTEQMKEIKPLLR